MGFQLGFDYHNNAKAWMTSSLYVPGMACELGPKAPDGRFSCFKTTSRVILFQTVYRIFALKTSNPTSQPMSSQMIRASFGASRPINRYDEGITPSEIYDINQLEAMRLADAAWHEVDATTVRNCWRKAGILKTTPPSTAAQPSIPISSLIHNAHQEDPILNAEKQVEAALDNLVATGVLQKYNRMDIEALLNPVDESQVMDETTDEEICRAVLAMKNARELAEVNQGDDDPDDDALIAPQPTRREVLQATSTIHQYINILNDPLARKLEGLLSSFRHQLCFEAQQSKQVAEITSYFARK